MTDESSDRVRLLSQWTFRKWCIVREAMESFTTGKCRDLDFSVTNGIGGKVTIEGKSQVRSDYRGYGDILVENERTPKL